MKNAVLNTFYKCFSQWSETENFCCAAGCAACCSQNVTLTTIEGERIINFLQKKGQEPLLFTHLKSLPAGPKPTQTTNEYVSASLQNHGAVQDSNKREGPCPFLSNNHCTIYPVRPFSCRCFVSQTLCQSDTSAVIPEHYLYGSIAVMQLIEHLDQFHYWGYLTDMLLYLQNKKVSTCEKDSTKLDLLIAQPLPGFLIPEKYDHLVQPLLQSIFRSRIGAKTVEQILNGQ